jgi:hypothetical protein
LTCEFSDVLFTSTNRFSNGTRYYAGLAAGSLASGSAALKPSQLVSPSGTWPTTQSALFGVTPAGPAGPVTDPVYEGRDESIRVTWSTPSFLNGGTVSEYVLQTSIDGENWGSDLVASNSASTYDITGLTNGLEYSVRIAVRTNAGLGTWDSRAGVRVKGIPTSEISSISSITQTGATVNFGMNTKGNLITPMIQWGYGANVSENSTRLQAINQANHTQSASISNLIPAHLYSVRIYATETLNTSATKTFVAAPSSPTGLVTTATANSINAKWNWESDGEASGSVIKYDVWAESSGSIVGTGCTNADTAVAGLGDCTITGLTPGTSYAIRMKLNISGADYGSTSSATVSRTQATKFAQTISFDLANLPRISSNTYSFDATPYLSTSSGLTPSLVSSTTTICTVSGRTILIASQSFGTCTITASQAGNATFGAATPVQRSFTVLRLSNLSASQSLPNDMSVRSAAIDLTQYVTASSGLTPTFTSLSSTICTVSGTMLTVLKSGVCTFRANQSGDSTYAAATALDRSLTSVKAQQDNLTISSTSGSFGTALSMTTTGGSGSGTISYTFSNGTASGCGVANSALTALSAGTCTVTAEKATDDTYLARSSSSTPVTLAKSNQTITFASLSDIGIGKQTRDITASTSADGLSVSLTSNSTSYCTISGTLVTFVSAGTCSITASQAGNDNFNAASDVTRTFTINAKATPVFSDIQVINLQSAFAGKRLGDSPVTIPTLNATHLGANLAGTWSYAMSGNPTLGISGQTATILRGGPSNLCFTFSPTDTVSYNPESRCVAVIIQSVGQTTPVVVDPQTTATSITNQYQLSASGGDGTGVFRYTVEPQDPTDSTNPMCQVFNGEVAAVNPGTCRIRATRDSDESFMASTPSEYVSFTFIAAPQSINFSLDSLVEYSARDIDTRVELDGLAVSDSGLAITYTSNTPSVCTISITELTIRSGGTCSVTASQAGNQGFLAATSVTDTIVISSIAQITPIDLTSTSTTLGTPLTLSASGGDGGGSLTYAVQDGISTGCAISSGILVATTPGTCLVTVQRAATSNYLLHSSMATAVEIGKTPQSIRFNLNSVTGKIIGDGPVAIGSLASTSAGLSPVFVSDTPNTCSVSGDVVTLLAVGTCTITASQDGNDLIAAATSVSASFTINALVRLIEPATPSGSSSVGNDSSSVSQAVAPVTLFLNRKVRVKAVDVAQRIGMTVPKKSKVTLRVNKSLRKICVVSGGRLRTIGPGACIVSVTVAPPKPKKGIKPPKSIRSGTFIVR